MSGILKLSATAFLALLILTPIASAQRGRIFIGGGFYGPGYGWYGPAYWGPYGYGYGYGPAPVPTTGHIKLVTQAKDAAVYIDGGYAGTAGKLKKFVISAGTHNIELRDNTGHVFEQQRVNVIGGKTIEIHAGFQG